MARKNVLLLVMMVLCCNTVMAQKNHNMEAAKSLDIFNNLYRHLDLMYVDTLDPQRTLTAGITGMLRSLDPYTEYFPEQKDLKAFMTGRYGGVGALIRYHLKQGTVVIDEPYANTPAQEVGLRKGDVVLAIDDSSMVGKDTKYVSEHLRGDAGTTFQLKIRRPSTDKVMKMKVTRRQIQYAQTIPYQGLWDAKTGYVSLSQFTEGCAQEVRRAVVELKRKGMERLVLDLRGNGGGSEAEAVSLVNLFVPRGVTVVSNRGKLKQASRDYKTTVEPLDTLMPLVVLVNGETASASEIVSGALQDLDRALIVGTRTYGKGLVQVPIELPYNSNAKITTSRYYIPSGRCIQAIDYTKRGDQGGGYKQHIPDSLTKVFYTRHGREVRDGGGITPDVVVKNDTLPNIAYYLSGSGVDSTEVMFDYVREYIDSHPTIAAPAEFHLTEDDWQTFRQRVIDSGFTYDPVSKKQLAELIKTAKFEGYYDDARAEFDALEHKLRHDVAREMDRHRDTIIQMVEMDIIAAYYYQAGIVEAGLHHDKQMSEAVRLLNNTEEYVAKLGQ
jgi:carboxyl-terminal processing protease